MGSSAIQAIGNGLTAAIDWVGETFDAFSSGGAFAEIVPVIGIICGIGIASWGLNKIVGLVKSIG